VLCSSDCYHGTLKQLRGLVSGFGIKAAFVDTSNTAAVEAALSAGPVDLLWIETPSNPTLKISDLAALTHLAHDRGALVCCDNTFATPILQRPCSLGVDLVMHSSTKFFGGHSDVTGGMVVVRDDLAVETRLRDYQGTSGAIPSPIDCWLLTRSLATLPYRVRAQSESAARIAQFLARASNVERVFYPGLVTHPGHDLAARQMPGGYGAIVSFCVNGGAAEALALAARTRLITQATSLGGVETLIEHRASIEGPDTPTPQNLLRMSIGLEHVDDLIADLGAALE
jgi:cystathionine gamma-synthase